ncbi:MAG: 3-oxoacyl-[acyl-carrier-protein] reductase [Candidatus Omnitrophica bacterium]|nr:3-oxoacyl-[acyl-carrier-protein] reductase [Candidatus Omnitrophota bacterium]
MLLSNKVAIITGGTRGIGKAIATEFAAQGADIVFSYLRNEDKAKEFEKEIKKAGRRVLSFKQDVQDFDAVKKMIEEVKAQFGRLDIVVNNAGILRDKALMFMKKEDWDDVISTNLTGAFNFTRAAIVTLLKQKSGNIINLTSVAGIKGIARQVNYSASKAGLIGFTKALAREVGPYNVRVNAIAPGYTETDMVTGIKEKHKEEILKGIPLARFGKAEEVAKTAVFLASEESRYITGEIITIDGGLTT